MIKGPELHELPALIGLVRGQNVLLSADVTRLAWIHRRLGTERVPTLLLDAFLARLGPEGTLVVPTFNFDLQDGETYDRVLTRPITGAVPTAAMAHPAFGRTRHPLHSFAVSGRARERFLALDDASSFSSGSPFALLRTDGFVVVGVDMELDRAFSYFHHVEELEQVYYRRWQDRRIIYIDQGVVTTRTYKLFAKRWGYANRLCDLAPLLAEAGAMRSCDVEGTKILVVDVALSHTVIDRDIREGHARSIVHFALRTWLRDLVFALRRRPPSRSHLQLASDAGTH
mgnify:CR=1 FL=1